MKVSFRKQCLHVKTAILTDPVLLGKLDFGPDISVGFIFKPPPPKVLGSKLCCSSPMPSLKAVLPCSSLT